MTPLDLEAAKRLVEAATPGPWEMVVQDGDEWWFGNGYQAVIRGAGPYEARQ